MGIDSLKIMLIRLVKTYFPFCKIQVMFNSGNRLGSFFQFKKKGALNARLLILYKFTCSSCNSAYVGKTKQHFLVRMFEHLGISLTIILLIPKVTTILWFSIILIVTIVMLLRIISVLLETILH